jgi:site-specific recombinase XerD
VTTLAALVPRFTASLVVERGCSPTTAGAYADDLARLGAYLERDLGRPPVAADLTTDAIRAYQAARAARVGVTTRARELSAVRTFGTWCVAREHLAANPADPIPHPKVPRGLPRALPAPVVAAVLEAIDDAAATDRRRRALLELLFATGVRIAEACALDAADVDAAQGVVRVRRGKGGKARVAPIGRPALAALDAYRADRARWLGREGAGPLFVSARGARLTPQAARADLRRWRAWSGAPASLTPHVLRHSFATACLNRGANLRWLQDRLGHASLDQTARYTEVAEGLVRGLYEQVHPRA